MGFPRQEYWSGLSCPPLGDLPNSGIEPPSLHLLHEQAGSLQLTLPESQSEGRSVASDSLRPHRLYSPWNSPGQNTGVGCPALLQGIFPTQGSNPRLLNWQQDSFLTEAPGNTQYIIINK